MATGFSPQRIRKPLTDEGTLAKAVELGKVTQVEALLAAGANPNVPTEAGMTVLMSAVAKGHSEIVRLLLEHGADVNARRTDGFSALLFAVFFGRGELVRLLLQQGADIEAQTRSGTSAEMWAAARGFSEILCLLKETRNPRCVITPVSQTISRSRHQLDVSRKAEQSLEHTETTVEAAPVSRDIMTEIEKENFVPAINGAGIETAAVFEPTRDSVESSSPIVVEPARRAREIPEASHALGLTFVVMLICGVATYTVLKLTTRQPKSEKTVVNSRDLREASERAKIPAVTGISPAGLQPAETESRSLLNARENSSNNASAADTGLKEVEPIRKTSLEEPKQKLKPSDAPT
jgi:hypothetical protein